MDTNVSEDHAQYSTNTLYGITTEKTTNSTLNLCSSLSVRDQVSQPYITTSKTTVSYILIFKFFEARWLNRMVANIP
jgi:hypothetical protein